MGILPLSTVATSPSTTRAFGADLQDSSVELHRPSRCSGILSNEDLPL